MSRINAQYDRYTKIWNGSKVLNFFNADCSIGKILFAFMRNNATAICQISDADGTALTYGETITFGIRIAQYLKVMGLNQEDIVGIVGGNTTYLLPVVLGCLLNCTPFHAVSPQQDEDTIKYLFSVTRPRVIFCDGNIYERISTISKIIKSNVYTLKYHRWDLPKVEDLLEPTKSEFYFVPETLKLGGDQTVAILCTSGTTGLPKCVCISNVACLFDFGHISNQDVMLSFGTIDCSSVLHILLFGCCHSAVRIITDKPFTPIYLLQLVEKYKVTILKLTAQNICALIKHHNTTKAKLSSIRYLSITGSNCHVPTLLKLQQLLSTSYISYGYSLTECGGITTNMGINNPKTVGKLIPGVKVKILDESGRSLNHGNIGEIYVQTSNKWYGYYANPSETRRVHDYDNWFHTGDLGYFDSDNYLYILGRKVDLLKFHGAQYWPQEIEDVIVELPDVVEACVFGLWNEVDGDAAAAAVVKVEGSRLSEQEIVEYVAERLIVTHKQLHCGVFFVQEIPKTGNGKVLRNQARDLALGKKWNLVMKNGLTH